jgi:hypothetical protein
MPWWFTPDVTSWTKNMDEWIGLRPKHWVVDPTGTDWLRKEPLARRPTELAIEAFTLELARRCGYSVAFGICCTWQAGGKPVRGFISRKFHDSTEQQSTGGQLIAPELALPGELSSDAAEQRCRVLTTLALTRTVLEKQEQRYSVDLIRPFLRMLVFDAWIGNADRHSANWAILVRSELHGSACRLAPMYDTAGCLLAELADKTVSGRFGSGSENEAIARYIARCPSGFGDGLQVPGVPHANLLEQLRGWPEWGVIAPPLIAFFSANLAMVDSLLDEIPEDWLALRRKQLVRRLLEARVKMLEGLVP